MMGHHSKSMEEEALVNPKQQKHNSIINLSIQLIAACIFVITLILVAINMSVGYDIQNIVSKPQLVIPSSFAVRTAGLVRDQEQRGTCWDFAAVRFLEERYRVQGEKLGLLPKNKFVRFSEQAHGVNIINFCKANPTKCPDTPGAKGIATDGYPSWIYHFQDYLNDKLTVDLPTCPYVHTESEVTDGKCDGMNEFIATKKIKYSVKNYRYLTQKNDIKRALFTKNSTFPLITELMWMEYFIPCEMSELYQLSTQCKEKQRKCPPDMQNEKYDRYCAVTTLMTTAEAEFIGRRYRRDPTLGAHAMLMVGYNDEYKMVGQSAGGFIVQNSWGPVMGHSLDYLLGKISRRAEEQICPGVEAPQNWVTIDYEGEDKYKLRKPTVLTYTPTGVKHGHFHTQDHKVIREALAGLPKLVDGQYYVLKQIEASVDQTSVVTIGVTKTSNPDQDFRLITEFIELPPMPFDLLSFFFTPSNTKQASDNYEDCGYYFIPYDFVDLTHQVNGLWWVDEMDIEFSKESFVVPGQNKPGDKEVLQATQVQNPRGFVSPTPWLDNENNVPRFK